MITSSSVPLSLVKFSSGKFSANIPQCKNIFWFPNDMKLQSDGLILRRIVVLRLKSSLCGGPNIIFSIICGPAWASDFKIICIRGTRTIRIPDQETGGHACPNPCPKCQEISCSSQLYSDTNFYPISCLVIRTSTGQFDRDGGFMDPLTEVACRTKFFPCRLTSIPSPVMLLCVFWAIWDLVHRRRDVLDPIKHRYLKWDRGEIWVKSGCNFQSKNTLISGTPSIGTPLWKTNGLEIRFIRFFVLIKVWMIANEFDFDVIKNMIFARLFHFFCAIFRKFHTSGLFCIHIFGIITATVFEKNKIIAFQFGIFTQSKKIDWKNKRDLETR